MANWFGAWRLCPESAALLFVVVSLAAGYLPARRAARIDPLSALRAFTGCR